MNQREERMVDIRKIIFYMLYRWKLILLCAICLSVGLTFFKFHKDTIAYNVKEVKENIADVKERLNDNELQDVEDALNYYKQSQNINNYLSESIIMSLDSNKVEMTKIQMAIQLDLVDEYTESQKQEYIYSIIRTYDMYIDGGTMAKEIYEETNEAVNVEYIQELFTVYSSGLEHDTNFVIDIKNVEQIPNFSDLIIEKISEYNVYVCQTVAPHDLKVISVNAGIKVDSELYSKQQNMWNTLYNYNSKVTTAMNKFSTDQMSYYNYCLGIVEEEVGDKVAPKLNFKFIVLGAILGALGACLLIFIKYMLSDYVISETDYTKILGLKYLGMLFDERTDALQKASVIKKMEYGRLTLENYDETLSFLAIKLSLICKALNINTLAIISSAFDEISEDVVSDTCNRIEREGITIYLIDNALTDGKSIRSLYDIGNCILIEKSEYSHINSIQKLLLMCDENNINVLGVVDIKK